MIGITAKKSSPCVRWVTRPPTIRRNSANAAAGLARGTSNPMAPASSDAPMKIVDEMQQFGGEFITTGSTIKWSSIQNGFAFESEDPNPDRNVGATI